MRLLRNTFVRHVGALTFYLALTIVMTWPVAAQIGSHIAGNPGDNHVYTWTLWLFRRSILYGQSPFYTTLIFYPQGISTWLHSPILTKSVPAFFLQAFLSPAAAYNIMLLAAITLMGYGSWLLIRDICGSDAAGLVGSLVFTFSPVYIAHAIAGHMDYIGAEFIPFFLLFFLRAFGSSLRWQNALVAGLFLALVALSNWGYLLFLIIFLVLHGLLGLVTRRREYVRWQMLRQYLILGATLALLIAPLAIPMLKASSSGNYDMTRYAGGAALDVADLFGFVTPSVYHPLLGPLAASISQRFTGNPAENTVFLGYTVLALSIYGAIRTGWEKTRLWVITALVFAILALGPGLHILGQFQFTWLSWMRMGSLAQSLGVPMKPEWVIAFDAAPMIPLPAAVFQLLPVFKWFRASGRLTVMVMLALSALAGYGSALLIRRLGHKRWLAFPASGVLTVLFCVLVLFEFWVVPFPTTTAAVPQYYSRLAVEPGEFGIVELPFLPYRAERQYHQTIHGKPLAYGYLSRVPEEGFAYIDSLQQQVYHPTGYFQAVDIRYLVLHVDQLSSLKLAEAETLQAALDANFELVESDGNLRVYRAYPIRATP